MRPLSDLIQDLTSGTEEQAEMVIDELTQWGESAIDSLLDLLGSTEADHRWWAARSLAAFSEDRAVDGLIEALSDPAGAVRQCAALSLRLNPSPQAIPALCGLLDDKDRFLARLAGDALTAIGVAAIPSLADAMGSERPQIRIEAARSLARMKREETIPILFKGVDDPSSMVRHWVEEGLTELKIGMVFFQS
jgi:HEAT repeat protein